MTQTKNQSAGRGRPKKGFDLVQKKVATESTQNANRGRPKKVRKIDDSINTKIDTKKKEISQIEKNNKHIESNLETITNFSAKKIENSNGNIHEIEFDDDKRANNFSLCLLICSMIFFIFAVYKTFFINNSQNYIDLESELNSISVQELTAQDTQQIQENNEGDYYELQGQESFIDETVSKATTETIPEYQEPINNEDEALIRNFYQYMNSLDFENINASVDKYLKNSDVFRTYFSQNRLNNFINKIDNDGLQLYNLSLISGDENTTRHYKYTLSYHVNGVQYEEERDAAVLIRNGKLSIGSLQCITTGCSKMPFFQK